VLSVINLFNSRAEMRSTSGPADRHDRKIPLTFVNENQFTFTVPASAVAGRHLSKC